MEELILTSIQMDMKLERQKDLSGSSDLARLFLHGFFGADRNIVGDADRALYKAKENGRNRVEVFDFATLK